jgi:hypothetical protein
VREERCKEMSHEGTFQSESDLSPLVGHVGSYSQSSHDAHIKSKVGKRPEGILLPALSRDGVSNVC